MRNITLLIPIILSACATTVPYRNCDQDFQDVFWEIPTHITEERHEDPTCFMFGSDGQFEYWNVNDEGFAMNWKCKDNGHFSIDPWLWFVVKPMRKEMHWKVDVHINMEEKPRVFKRYTGVVSECDLDDDGRTEIYISE